MAWQSTWQPAAIDRSDLERLLHEFEAKLARIRARTRHVDIARIGDDALQLGNKALRKLTHEVEHRPLVTLAIAAGIGALAFALLVARRD
jgi:ElaB/YqjD/DUF883 family membrane-anchored ribosome-binding protein